MRCHVLCTHGFTWVLAWFHIYVRIFFKCLINDSSTCVFMNFHVSRHDISHVCSFGCSRVFTSLPTCEHTFVFLDSRLLWYSFMGLLACIGPHPFSKEYETLWTPSLCHSPELNNVTIMPSYRLNLKFKNLWYRLSLTKRYETYSPKSRLQKNRHEINSLRSS